MNPVMTRSFSRWVAAFALALAASGFAQADYFAGLSAYQRGEFEDAYREWIPAANAGHAESQYRIARLYTNGYGVEQDDAAGRTRTAAASSRTSPRRSVGTARPPRKGGPSPRTTSR